MIDDVDYVCCSYPVILSGGIGNLCGRECDRQVTGNWTGNFRCWISGSMKRWYRGFMRPGNSDREIAWHKILDF